MKKVLISFVMMAFLSIGTSLAATEPVTETSNQVGVVDVNRVVNGSIKLQAMQGQLNERGKELSNQLEEDKANLSPEEFEKKRQASYDEFLRIKQDMESRFDIIMKQALEQIAKEKKLAVILYKNGVAFGGIDVTVDVINVVDSQ